MAGTFQGNFSTPGIPSAVKDVSNCHLCVLRLVIIVVCENLKSYSFTICVMVMVTMMIMMMVMVKIVVMGVVDPLEVVQFFEDTDH